MRETFLQQWQHIHFDYPWVLLFLPLIPFLGWFRNLLRIRKSAYARFPDFELLRTTQPSLRTRLLWLPDALRYGTLMLLTVVLARPRGFIGYSKSSTEGIDIVLSVDVSLSMLAKDFRPNRLEAAKKTAAEFIRNRPNDRIGLVAFSGESIMMCPVTTDHGRVLEQVEALRTGMLEDGTAIGDGLASAIARLKDSEAKSKVVILLTDGMNNKGMIYPETAAEIAQTFGIRVYTIGVGTRGKAESPVGIYPNGQVMYQLMEVEIDDQLLTQIAEKTGGRYFRATNNEKLREIYNEIDKLEKTRLFSMEYQAEPDLYAPFALGALLLLTAELLLRFTFLSPAA